MNIRFVSKDGLTLLQFMPFHSPPPQIRRACKPSMPFVAYVAGEQEPDMISNIQIRNYEWRGERQYEGNTEVYIYHEV